MKKTFLVLFAVVLLSSCQKNPEDEKDVFTSISDAINKQLVLKCEYVDTDGEKTITYIKGRTVRLKGTGEQETIEGLIKGDAFYLWDSVKKEGMEINLLKMAEDGSVSMGEKTIKSVDDVVSILQEKKDSCVLSPESAGLLDLPTDVKFTKSEDIF